MSISYISFIFFFNDTATTEIYTLSLHDALPIFPLAAGRRVPRQGEGVHPDHGRVRDLLLFGHHVPRVPRGRGADRKSTRLNSSHVSISYAVFCLKKKTNNVTNINMSFYIVADDS